MILYLVIQALLFILSLIFAVFPTVETLPWGVDSVLSDGMGYYRTLMDVFPPLSTVLNAVLIYIGYKLAIIVLRFFLGSRTPVTQNH